MLVTLVQLDTLEVSATLVALVIPEVLVTLVQLDTQEVLAILAA